MKKRGIVPSILVGILLLILMGGIILYFTLRHLSPLYTETIDKEACHMSVMARDNALLKGTHWTPEILPLNCKTQEIKISSTNEEFIKREIANAMYDCWWTLGEGKADFFRDVSWWDIKNPLGIEKANCIICSTLQFEGGAKNRQLDIQAYLEQTKIPQKNITYLNYFLEQADAKKFPGDIKAPVLNTGEDYAIVFMAMKGPEIKKTLIESGATGAVSFMIAGTVAGTAIGAFGGPIGAAGGAIIGTIGGLIQGLVIGGVNVGANVIASISHCDTKRGCNNLLIVPLTAEGLTICQSIESIP